MARRRKRAATADHTVQVPMQPVDKPILSSPYEEPSEYWVYDLETGEASRAPGRRPAGHWYREEATAGNEQAAMLTEENFVSLELVNRLRSDVRRWRDSGYEGATPTTRRLLQHWRRDDLVRRLFFCQIEAVETVIYLNEIRMAGRSTRFRPESTDDDLVVMQDGSPEPGTEPFARMACKMATGSGKTVVMAMLIAWSFCNRGRQPSDVRFPSATVIVCPNLTILERLQVLRPENPSNYYSDFDLVPTELRGLLNTGRILIVNWNKLKPESRHAESGATFQVVNKGAEGPDAFASRVLGAVGDRGEVMVLNDEGHHAYRPKPVSNRELTGDDEDEAETAKVWTQGLDRINSSCGIRFCLDLSATPFYYNEGTGYPVGQPFPWIVSDFSLVDAIESGIVKVPRLPVDDNTGRPEPRYFKLWQTIDNELQPGQRRSGKGRGPKPEPLWEHAQSALATLASQYKERSDYVRDGSPGQDKAPPVMILVCHDMEHAKIFYEKISGETTVASATTVRGKSKVTKEVVYGDGVVFPELFSNTADERKTVLYDSNTVKSVQRGELDQRGEDLRKVVDTVGKLGQPGANIRCVVSVKMLNEGWDANNVTHILGLRAFRSQLLCEQVVGRGLRRMDYTPDPETGLLTEEYVDVYGIPFSVIPYKGRPKDGPAPEDRPKHHVRAMDERLELELMFPNVDGFSFELRRDFITADVSAMEPFSIDPSGEPTAVFIKPQVGYEVGNPTLFGPGDLEQQSREVYYASTHIQKIKFEIARQVVDVLTGFRTADLIDQDKIPSISSSRHLLFPQVYKLVDEFVKTKVQFNGVNKCELGLARYAKLVAERLLYAIEPNVDACEPPLIPIVNRYKPVGSTAEVDFKTVAAVHSTTKSHLNQVVLDTKTWESAAAFRLEESPVVKSYAKNDRLGLHIGYEYDGVSRYYEPDFLVKLANDVNLVLEIKGFQSDEDSAKHEAANRWVRALNNWGRMGQWQFEVCHEPQMLGELLREWGRGG